VSRALRVLIIGAGAGGLSAAAVLAAQGCAVTILERADTPGGKMRQLMAGGALIDAGPTVFTMRWVFDALFEAAGGEFEGAVDLTRAGVLARHAWADGGALDLHADIAASEDAIRAFAGAADAAAFRAFAEEARKVHDTLLSPFMAAQKPNPLSLALAVRNPMSLRRIAPFETLAAQLARRFRDPRLRQLFGRYSTYVGSSPYLAPATLMLIAHVEQEGVWLVEGGMHALARAMLALGQWNGAQIRYAAHASEISVADGRVRGVRLANGEVIAADAIVFNGDAGALGAGLLGDAVKATAMPTPRARRSLSAVTWCARAPTRGFDLSYHNVFFGPDYEQEFDAVFRQRTIAPMPTVYVCAQDRVPGAAVTGAERLLVLVNAPPDGDLPGAASFDTAAIAARAEALLDQCGFEIAGGLEAGTVTAPAGFHQLFPGTGGALYGTANHSPMASFARPGARTRIGGLYLAGGSVHPGAGVPMATLSGMRAAEALLADITR
jgi:1-hydroxycarotenoid 3,4-desaturase